MLSWLFKKRGTLANPAEETPASRPPPQRPPAPAATAPAAQAAATARDNAQWSAQLRAATGDDDALLRLALSAQALDHKFAAVQMLATEAALTQAERGFRNRDRKVHRLAKQRLEAVVAQRVARAKATALLQRTHALLGQTQVPVNHLVALDREWAVLPAHTLEPQQCQQFSEWRERIDATLRDAQASQQRLQRWCADAQRSLSEAPRALADAAEQGSAIELSTLCARVALLRDASPDDSACAGLERALVQWLQEARSVEQRLAWLEAPSAPCPDPAPPPELALAEARAEWGALPMPTDAALMRALDRRFERMQAARAPRVDVAADPAPAATGSSRQSAEASAAAQQVLLENLLQQAEVAIAEGQLGALQQHLFAIDAALDSGHVAALPEAWRARHQALRAEHARLKGWQQWGGGRARDDLCAQAEALAQRTSNAANANAPGTPGAPSEPSAPRAPRAPAAPKLNLKAYAQDIHALRQRWKELDRLGAPASLQMWQRFDLALQTAHQPVAAQQAAMKAARQDNLATREALLATLEALPVPEPAGEAAAQPQGTAVAWRELVRERDRFQLAWRKLGPIEHTVPAQACEALQQRLRLAVQRIDTPLHQAQQTAAVAREILIARAQALRPDASPRVAPGDVTRQVRELQAEWQDQARRLPLPRALEAALWDRFRAATDALFAQRDAALAARDAELAAQLAAREALLERLSECHADALPADIERMLVQVDHAWRQAGELPRGSADGLDSRYRSARAAAVQARDDARRRHWMARCDGLATRLLWCQQREDTPAVAAELAERWDALAPLPEIWQQALAQRWAHAGTAGPLPEVEVDALLLQLEAELQVPAAPPWQAARQQLKLRALKQALEGRGAAPPGPAAQAAWLLAMLRQSGLSPVQRSRLQAVVAALRQAAPGALGSPLDAA